MLDLPRRVLAANDGVDSKSFVVSKNKVFICRATPAEPMLGLCCGCGGELCGTGRWAGDDDAVAASPLGLVESIVGKL